MTPRKQSVELILYLTTIIATAFLASCGGGPSSAIQGKWQIESEPDWVDDKYLAWNSDTWTFLPDGVCILGKATGEYTVEASGRIKVKIGMQEATPGFTGLFEPSFSGETLTMTNLAEDEPVILKRVGD